MLAGISRLRISGGSGPAVDIMKVVESARLSPPCVPATFTKVPRPREPE